jgi:hypothetical protein
MESRLFHVAAAIALALRKPKLLTYDGTTGPNSVIEKPGRLSIHRTSGRNVVRGMIEYVEGTTLVTDCLDFGRISHIEELGQIAFRMLWGECV